MAKKTKEEIIGKLPKSASPQKKKEYTPDMVQLRADFVRLYIEQDFKNATGAYQKVYGVSEKVAASGASRLLKDDNIQEALATELAAVLKEKRRPLEKQVLDVWMKRAFYDPTEIIDLDGKLVISTEELRAKGLQVCIDSINEKLNAQGMPYIEYKLADRDKALDMIQKYIQMVKPFDLKIDPTGENDRSFTITFAKPKE